MLDDEFEMPFDGQFLSIQRFHDIYQGICQMLVNWLLSELDEVNYQRHSLVQLEVRQPIINFYTMLLLAGVIRPVEDGNINGVDMDFESSFEG
ncbi:hypothetical protein QYM36_000461 [Artemia franciscana]|nr:hypothetical protein QYM36_000461 [Artemia franciscana]